jgi:tetratricopeptide (TPR) repeat protein
MLSAACCVAAIFQAGAVGDTIHTRGARSYHDLKIVDFAQGKLDTVETRTGNREQWSLNEIALIRVDDNSVLNDAERLLGLEHHAEAIETYQTALDRASAKWQITWIKVRLLNLLAGQEQLGQAVHVYVDLAETIPDWLIQVAPARNRITADNQQVSQAIAALTAARTKTTSARVRIALNRFIERLGGGENRADGHEAASVEPKEADVPSDRRPGLWLDDFAEQRLKTGKFALIASATDRLLTTAVRADLPAVLYWRGRAWLGQGEADAAALALLRVAIEFPRSKYTPRALFYAVDALSIGNRREYAENIRNELITRYQTSEDVEVSRLVAVARAKNGR